MDVRDVKILNENTSFIDATHNTFEDLGWSPFKNFFFFN